VRSLKLVGLTTADYNWLMKKAAGLCNSTRTQAMARGTRIPAKTVPMGDSQNGEYPSLYEYS